MFRHIVMWTLKKPEDLESFAKQLKTVEGCVPGMIEFDVGVKVEGNLADHDVVLVSSFKDRAAFEAYRVEPGHRKVADVLGTMAATRVIMDYESIKAA